MRTTEALSLFEQRCRYRGVTPGTRQTYTWALAKLAARHEVLPEHPEPLMGLLVEEPLSLATRYELWCILRVFYHWLSASHGVPDAMQGLAPPSQRRRQFPRALSREDVDWLLETAAPGRDLTMISLLLDTGMRVGELTSLRRGQVYDDSVRVHGKTGERFIPVTPNVMRLVREQGDGHYLWNGRRGPLSLSGATQVVRRTMAKAGFVKPKAGPHVLRHTFALQYIVAGGDVFSLRQLLGHASVDSTMVYVYMHDRALKEAHGRYSPMAGRQLRLQEENDV